MWVLGTNLRSFAREVGSLLNHLSSPCSYILIVLEYTNFLILLLHSLFGPVQDGSYGCLPRSLDKPGFLFPVRNNSK